MVVIQIIFFRVKGRTANLSQIECNNQLKGYNQLNGGNNGTALHKNVYTRCGNGIKYAVKLDITWKTVEFLDIFNTSKKEIEPAT